MRQIIFQLPELEKYDLRGQLSRSSKAIPRLIAEGFAKRHQKSGFQKYLDDALAETNETMVSLEQVKDLYSRGVSLKLITGLLEEYDQIARQIFQLRKKWKNFN